MNALRVLHVDDETDIREVVEISLGLDPGFVTRSCGSGQEALALIGDWLPDIILLDVMMPVMDGPATLAVLQEKETTAGIPVVFMTARAQSREIQRFRSLGAAGVIQKPFDPMKLAASVRDHMESPEVRLIALRQDFRRRLEKDAAVLQKLRAALDDVAALPKALTEIRDITHRLAGAGGIFGFHDVGNAAAAIEEGITFGVDSAGTDAIASALDRLLADVEAVSTLRKEYFVLEARG
jgi:CheY-like chemotaxis protein